MSVMEFSSVLSSNSNHSIEEFEVNDRYDNLMLVDDVSEEETEGVVPEFEEEEDFEDISLHTCDYDDFAVGVAQLEDSTRIENVPFNDSELFDSFSDAGRAFVVVKEEGNLVEDFPGSDYSLAPSEFFSPSELSRIEGCNARFEAINATREYFEFLKEEETREVKGLGSDVVLTQDYPTSDASSDLILTPLQLFRIKTINDAYKARNEEKEMKAVEALLLADMSITQCSGYGVINGNHVINRVIEGLLPKIHSNQLTRNWLLNEKNSFETIFYQSF